MKRQHIVISLAALLVVVAVIWMLMQATSVSPKRVRLATPTPQSTPVTMTSATHTSPTPLGGTPQMPDSSISATQLASPGPAPMPRGSYQGMNDPRWPIYWKKRQEDQTFEWKTPISFYGKVLDQNQQPIPGVEVSMNWTDMSPKGTSAATLTTDADGVFSITDIQGKNFGVRSLKKDGYEEAKASNRYSFEYAGFWEPTYHEPDPNNPVIFHMRKRGKAEPMIQYGPTLFGASNNGMPASFDLVTGRKTAGGSGNITLRITKGPKMNKRFDWTATVEGAGGAGLIESTDEFMVTAPEEGYQSQWTFSQKATDEKYQSQVQRKFYVKTGDSKYARVEMRIIPEYNETAAVDLTVYLNPKPGSRNLEFDPSKLVNSDTSRVKSP